MLEKLLGSIMGSGGKGGLMGMLGSDAFKNVAGLGTNIWQGMQQNDMMKFQQGLAQKSFNMQKDIFDENKDDRERRKNLDFTLS